jgi:hypothetical protein
MFSIFRHGRVKATAKLAAIVAFYAGVFLGGVVALPILGEHFFGNRRQPVFVVDLLIFGGVCAVLAAVLLADKLGYVQTSKERGRPAEPAQSAPREPAVDAWTEQVRSDARLAHVSSYLPEIATTPGEHRHHTGDS